MQEKDSTAPVQVALYPAEKRCLKCGQTKPIEDFPRSERKGRRARCKRCHCEDTKQRQKAKRAWARAERAAAVDLSSVIVPLPTSKLCARCEEVKSLEEFARCSSGSLGRQSYCRICAWEYKQEAKARRAAGVLTERQVLAAEGLKRCAGCAQAKPLEAFKRQGKYRFYLCKDCQRLQRGVAREASLGPARAEAERLYAQGLKRCTLCQEVKDLASFGTHRFTADGLNWWCKTCNVANATAYYATHSEARIAYARAYYEANRTAIRAAAREQLRRLRETDPVALHALYSAHYYRNKESSNLRVRAWAKKNPERRRHLARASYHRNKSNGKHIVYGHNRRARLLAIGGRLTTADIVLLYEVQGGRCAYCLADLATAFHRDHMTAVTRQGRNDISNIALACPTCNLRKNNKSAGQFLALLIKEKHAQATA